MQEEEVTTPARHLYFPFDMMMYGTSMRPERNSDTTTEFFFRSPA